MKRLSSLYNIQVHQEITPSCPLQPPRPLAWSPSLTPTGLWWTAFLLCPASRLPPLFSWTPELDFLAPPRLYLGAIFEIFHGSPPSSPNQLFNLLLFPCFREPQSSICSLKILGHISSSYLSPLFLFSFTLTLSPLHSFLLVWSSHLLFKQSFFLSQLAFVIWFENEHF